MASAQKRILYLLFVMAIILNVLSWLYVRDIQARWLNVPPVPLKEDDVPSEEGALAFALGDQQLAYRTIGIMLQNLGDTGGRSTPLRDYDYEALSRWFILADKLDPGSHFTPFLAAFYFGAVDDPSRLPPLLDYLERVGVRPGGERWRWLAQAVYIARWQMNDLDKALQLARKLAALDYPGMPTWTDQMPAFILGAKGNKEEALAIMLEILKTSADKIHPNEVNFTRDYICTRLLDESEAAGHPLCRDIP